MMKSKEVHQNSQEVKVIPSVQVVFIRETNSQPEIFLVKKVTKHFFSQWCFPGGKLDSGENPLIAACREMKEETGVIIKDTDLHYFRTTKSTIKDSSTVYEYPIDVFLVNANNLSPFNASEQEHSSAKWFTFDQALQLHTLAINEAQGNGIDVTMTDKIPNAIAPKTLETINILHSQYINH